jgi:hypothetical protein
MATHVIAGDHIVSSDRLGDLKNSLPRLGSGVSRTAYDLGNGTVLKIGSADGFAGGNRTEVEAWQELSGSDIAEFLGEIVAYDEEDYRWLIMRKADGVLNDSYEARQAWYRSNVGNILSRAGIDDLHDGNVGYVIDEDSESGYRFFAVDYAMNQNRGGAYNSCRYSSHCGTCCEVNGGCSRHSWLGRQDACCGSARFKMDDCETLQGCRQEWCDAPDCSEYAIRDLGTVRQLVQGHHWAGRIGVQADNVWESDRMFVCHEHLPVTIGQANAMREIAGQGYLILQDGNEGFGFFGILN